MVCAITAFWIQLWLNHKWALEKSTPIKTSLKWLLHTSSTWFKIIRLTMETNELALMLLWFFCS